MSDTPNDPLGLAPAEIVVPGPDAATVAQLFAQHQRALDAINHLEPSSLYFKREDLAIKARTEAQMAFDTLCARHGITKPEPVTPETLAVARFEADWRHAEIPAPVVAEFEARATAAKALPAAARGEAVAALQRSLGETRWAQLNRSTSTRPTVSRATFVATEGARAYQELVSLAKASGKYDEALSHDEYALSRLAGYGKYNLAKAAAAKQMKGS